jgi:hypothetical protein
LYPATNNAPAIVPFNTTATSKAYSLAANTTYYVSVTGGLSYVCYQLSISNAAVTVARQVDYKETKLAENNVVESMKAVAFPNPHKGSFNLKVESPEDGMASIQLLSADGRLTAEKNVMLFKGRSNTIPFGDLRDAVLFYRIILGKRIASGKVIRLE